MVKSSQDVGAGVWIQTLAARKFGSVHFFPAFGLELERFNLAAMRVDEDGGVGDFGDFARLAFDIAKLSHQVFAAVKQPDPFTAQSGPGTGCRVAGADEVINVTHMVGPVDLLFIDQKPAFVTGV